MIIPDRSLFEYFGTPQDFQGSSGARGRTTMLLLPFRFKSGQENG